MKAKTVYLKSDKSMTKNVDIDTNPCLSRNELLLQVTDFNWVCIYIHKYIYTVYIYFIYIERDTTKDQIHAVCHSCVFYKQTTMSWVTKNPEQSKVSVSHQNVFFHFISDRNVFYSMPLLHFPSGDQ